MSDQAGQHPIHIAGGTSVVQPVHNAGSARDIVGQQNIYGLLPARPADPGELAAACALLGRMPAGDDDPPPGPGPLAPCSYMHQLTPNPLFTGRDAELRAVARGLRDGSGTVVVASGIGGVGKTQLAIEVAHRYGPYFAGGVFWASCAEPATVGTAVARCGERGLVDWRPDFGQLGTGEQAALVCAAWQSPMPRLLILDNCEDEAVLQQWRPPTGGCRVLVTSRRAEWGVAAGVRQQPLRALGPEDGVSLLLGYRADLGRDGAARVAAALGGLPLALHLAGSFLRRYRQFSADAYLAQLGGALTGHPSLQGRAAERGPDLRAERNFAAAMASGDPEQIAALVRDLDARAGWAEDGAEKGSPYIALADRLRQFAAHLSET